MATYDYKRFAILCVDDEEQALKYFRKAFEKDFRVHTAPNVAAALEIFHATPDIAIVITDQRMPGKTGVDLLAQVRTARPSVIRMLTTAYSDIDSAISAVNTGAIFKYIVKPWDIRSLRVELLRAMEFYLVQQERDMLFREKLNVLQRLIVTDRIRSLTILATGLSHHIRNSMTALKVFLDLAPSKLRDELPEAALKNPEFWEDFWSMAQKESQRILHMVHQVAEATVTPIDSFDEGFDLRDVLAAAGASKDQGGAALDVVEREAPTTMLRGNRERLIRLFQILSRYLAKEESTPLRLELSPLADHAGTTGVRIRMTSPGFTWTDQQLSALFTAFVPLQNPQDFSLDLLSAFFIVHHHGGDIEVIKSDSAGSGFEIRLPHHPEAVNRPTLEDDCMEKLFLQFDLWSEQARH